MVERSERGAPLTFNGQHVCIPVARRGQARSAFSLPDSHAAFGPTYEDPSILQWPD